MTRTESTRPRRILLATDLSCRCDRALDRAIRLAAEWNAELVAAYVVEPSKSLEYSLERSRPLFRRRPDPVDRMRWRLKRDVASAADNIRTIVEKGEAADTLLAIADREACDLIVTGVARDEALGRIFFGGTVDRLVRRSTVPVLVVRDRPVRAYRDIVVATDFSEASLQALSAAATLFPQGRLTLFHAYDVPFAGLIQDRDFEAELREMEKALGDKILSDERLEPGLRARTDVVIEHGTPERLLADYIEDKPVDLTVIGSHGRGALLDSLIGGTAMRLLENLEGDLLLVRYLREKG